MGKNKNGWKWLKEQFLNSLIWFLPHPIIQKRPVNNSDVISFEYKEDFDTNGIFYALGTDFGKNAYENPAKTGKVEIKSTALHKNSQPNYEFIGRNKTKTFTQDVKGAFFSVNFGAYGMKVTHYTLRHYISKAEFNLRNWEFQGSNDGEHWKCLKKHTDDNSLKGKSKSHTWPIDTDEYFSYFRVLVTGATDYNCLGIQCSGMEMYGDWSELKEKQEEEKCDENEEENQEKYDENEKK